MKTGLQGDTRIKSAQTSFQRLVVFFNTFLISHSRGEGLKHSMISIKLACAASNGHVLLFHLATVLMNFNNGFVLFISCLNKQKVFYDLHSAFREFINISNAILH